MAIGDAFRQIPPLLFHLFESLRPHLSTTQHPRRVLGRIGLRHMWRLRQLAISARGCGGVLCRRPPPSTRRRGRRGRLRRARRRRAAGAAHGAAGRLRRAQVFDLTILAETSRSVGGGQEFQRIALVEASFLQAWDLGCDEPPAAHANPRRFFFHLRLHQLRKERTLWGKVPEACAKLTPTLLPGGFCRDGQYGAKCRSDPQSWQSSCRGPFNRSSSSLTRFCSANRGQLALV